MKPAAQLTSHLLARKGEALPLGITPGSLSRAGKEVLNGLWGNTPAAKSSKKTTAAPKAPAGQTRQHEDEDPQDNHSDRVAMTLRLNPGQHRRLRLISVHSHQSAREIMTAALEIYLDHLERELDIVSCDCLNIPK